MAPLPDPAVFDGAAPELSSAAGVLDRRSSAATSTGSTIWTTPAADRARLVWARADGAARTGAAELRVCATHLIRLADAVEDVAAAMASAHRRAREGLLELQVPVEQGGAALSGRFQQTHTDPDLYQPGELAEVGFDQPVNDWLSPSTGLRP